MSVEPYEPSKRLRRHIANQLIGVRVEQAIEADGLRHLHAMAGLAMRYDVDLINRITRIIEDDDNPLKREALLRRFMQWQNASELERPPE